MKQPLSIEKLGDLNAVNGHVADITGNEIADKHTRIGVTENSQVKLKILDSHSKMQYKALGKFRIAQWNVSKI